jgi:hypothetical protein
MTSACRFPEKEFARSLLAIIHETAIDHGLQDFDLGEFVDGAGQNIAIHNNKVSQLSFLQRTFGRFFERQVSWSRRQAAQRFQATDPLTFAVDISLAVHDGTTWKHRRKNKLGASIVAD